MKRTIVQIVKMRLADVEVGDVVNREPDANEGWFRVEEKRRLPNGDINVTNTASHASIMGADFDVIAVQLPQEAEMAPPPPPPEAAPAPAKPVLEVRFGEAPPSDAQPVRA